MHLVSSVRSYNTLQSYANLFKLERNEEVCRTHTCASGLNGEHRRDRMHIAPVAMKTTVRRHESEALSARILLVVAPRSAAARCTKSDIPSESIARKMFILFMGGNEQDFEVIECTGRRVNRDTNWFARWFATVDYRCAK